MFMIIPPVDFQAQCTPRNYRISTRRPTIHSTNVVTGVHRASSSSSSPSDCLAQLEEMRSVALRVQDKIQILWIVSTDNKSPARSVLPILSYKDRSSDTFHRLQRLVDNFNHHLRFFLSTNLKFEYSGTFKFNVVFTVIRDEQKRVAQFLDAWEGLEPYLQSGEITRSKEAYDLLESALGTLRRLQDQLVDIHHDIFDFLEPQNTSRIHPLKFALAATSACNGLQSCGLESGLRRRGNGLVKCSHEISSLTHRNSLLNERTITR